MRQYRGRGARQADERRNLAQVVVHQGDVGRLDSGVGAGRTHGETNVGTRKGGRVVDAVPHHADLAPTADEALNSLELVFGQLVATGFGDPDLGRDGVRRVLVVPGEHQRAHAERLQVGHGFAAGFLHCVSDGEDAEHRGVVHQQDGCLALALQGLQLGLQRDLAEAELFRETVIAHLQHPAGNAAAHTAPRQRREIFNFVQRDAVPFRLAGNGLRHWVV